MDVFINGEIDRVTQNAIDQSAEKKLRTDQSMVDLAHAAGIDSNKTRMKQLEADAKSLQTAVQKVDTNIVSTKRVDQNLQTDKKI